MNCIAFSANAMKLFFLAMSLAFIGSCEKSVNSQENAIENPTIAHMGERLSTVYLEPNATEVLYTGSFDNATDIIEISSDSLKWGNEILDEDNNFTIPLSLGESPDKYLAIDTILVKIIKADGDTSMDSVVVIRSAPILTPLYGDSLPVVDKNGKYRIEFTLSHPGGLRIVDYWINDYPVSTPCSLDSTQTHISCNLRLEGDADTVRVGVEDEIGAVALSKVIVFQSHKVAQLVTSLRPQMRLGIHSQEIAFQTKVITNGTYSRFTLIQGTQTWSFDSNGITHVKMPLPPLNDPSTIHQIDTLPFYLRFTNGKNVDTLVHIIHRMRPQFTLTFPATYFHDNALFFRYPDTLARFTGTFADSLAAPIAKILINGMERFTNPTGKVFIDSIPLTELNKTLSIRVEDTLGNFMETITPTSVTGRNDDYDKDGILNYEEVILGFNVDMTNSDKDAIPDISEDRDKDGLSDILELRWNSNISNNDTDNDGLTDSAEYYSSICRSDPLKVDTDGDGSSDSVEVYEASNPCDATVGGDLDRDGLSNKTEL